MKPQRTALIAFLSLLAANAAAQEVIEEVIVKINDDIVTLSEFNNTFEPLRQQIRQIANDEEVDRQIQLYKERTFNAMINVKLIKQRAAQLGLHMPESQFQRYVDYYKQQSGSTTDEEFRQALAGLGMTMDDLRQRAENQFIQGQLFRVELLSGQEENTESKVQEYYERNLDRYRQPEEYGLSQMVFPFDPQNKEEVRKEAEAVLARIRDGEDFGEVYREVTPQAAPDADGNIGVVSPENLRQELRDAVERVEAGDVCDVIELPAAFVILKCNEKQEARAIPLDEIQERVLADMQNEQIAEGLEELIKRYKQRSFIEVKSDEFMALYDPESTLLSPTPSRQ